MRTHENTTARAKSAVCGTSWPEAVPGALRLTILGHLPSMKNRREMAKNHRTGKLFPRKNDEALKYVADFCLQVPPECRNLALGSPRTPLRAIVSVFYRSARSDLDTALVYDCLQLAGVIANDVHIHEHHEYKHVDADNPRVEITLEEL